MVLCSGYTIHRCCLFCRPQRDYCWIYCQSMRSTRLAEKLVITTISAPTTLLALRCATVMHSSQIRKPNSTTDKAEYQNSIHRQQLLWTVYTVSLCESSFPRCADLFHFLSLIVVCRSEGQIWIIIIWCIDRNGELTNEVWVFLILYFYSGISVDC